MALSGWRCALGVVVVVVVMVGDVMAHPYHNLSPNPLLHRHRLKRQLPPSIDNDALLCLLLAGAEDKTPSSCGSSPTNPFSPPSPQPSFQPPSAAHDPPPPRHDPPSPPHIPPPPPPQIHDPSPPPPVCSCVPHWQCKDKKSSAVVDGDSLTSIVLDLRSNFGCGAPEEVCCKEIDPHGRPPTPPPVTLTCGQRNPLGVSSTFLGFQNQETQFGEFPWTVAVTSSQGYGPDAKPIFVAGGSLVHPQLVLSVAHKLVNSTAADIKVRLGDWNLAKTIEAVPHQEIGVSEVVIHPAYSSDPYHYYDVVVLVLEWPAVLGPTVNTICLPIHENDFLPDKCVVSGWGKKNFDDAGRFQEVMKAVSMPLVRHETCQTALQEARLGNTFILHHSFLCAGGETENQDSCTGDGGSPLVCPLRSDTSRYTQVGVVAWGIGCGRVGVPGVYADVLSVGLWLDAILNDKFGVMREGHGGLHQPIIDVRSPPKPQSLSFQ